MYGPPQTQGVVRDLQAGGEVSANREGRIIISDVRFSLARFLRVADRCPVFVSWCLRIGGQVAFAWT